MLGAEEDRYFFSYINDEGKDLVNKLADLIKYEENENEDQKFFELFERIDKTDIINDFMLDFSYLVDIEIDKRVAIIEENIKFEYEYSSYGFKGIYVDFKVLAIEYIYNKNEIDSLSELITDINSPIDHDIAEYLDYRYAMNEVDITDQVYNVFNIALESLISDFEDELLDADVSDDDDDDNLANRIVDISTLKEKLDKLGIEVSRVKEVEIDEYKIYVIVPKLEVKNRKQVKIKRRVDKGDITGDWEDMYAEIDNLNMYLQPNLFENNDAVVKFKDFKKLF